MLHPEVIGPVSEGPEVDRLLNPSTGLAALLGLDVACTSMFSLVGPKRLGLAVFVVRHSNPDLDISPCNDDV